MASEKVSEYLVCVLLKMSYPDSESDVGLSKSSIQGVGCLICNSSVIKDMVRLAGSSNVYRKSQTIFNFFELPQSSGHNLEG